MPIEKKKRYKRKSVTDAMETNGEKVNSAVERRLIVIAPPCADEWPDAPSGCLVVRPGERGHDNYIYNIKGRLKDLGFRWDKERKLWHAMFEDHPPEWLVA